MTEYWRRQFPTERRSKALRWHTAQMLARAGLKSCFLMVALALTLPVGRATEAVDRAPADAPRLNHTGTITTTTQTPSAQMSGPFSVVFSTRPRAPQPPATSSRRTVPAVLGTYR